MSLLNAMIPRSAVKIPSLRPYQSETKEKVQESWNDGAEKVLAVMSTGAGKTLTAGSIFYDEITNNNGRVLVLTDRKKLTRQFAQAFEGDYGIPASIEMGGVRAENTPLISSTIQTMATNIAKGRYKPDDFTLCCIDEAHGAASESFMRALKYFKAKWLGLTATPHRTDKKDLMKIFDAMVEVEGAKLNNLIRDGYLAPLVINQIPLSIQLTERSGDYDENDIAEAIDPYLERCAETLIENAKDRCSLVFLPLVKTSKRFCEILNNMGLKASHVDGTMDEEAVNKEIRRLEVGDISAICCSMLLTVGVDIRPVNCILNLRPTKSWTLAVQIYGRATRLFDPSVHGPVGTIWPKKKDSLILDPIWITEKHNLLQRPAVLVTSDPNEIEILDKKIRKGGGGKDKGVNLLEALDEAIHEREEALKNELMMGARKKSRLVNACEFFLAQHRPDLVDYEPMSKRDSRPITFKQKMVLEKNAIDIAEVKDFGHASLIIDQIVQRGRANKATIKMAKFAMSLGMEGAFDASFDEVKAFLDANSPPRRKVPHWVKRKQRGY